MAKTSPTVKVVEVQIHLSSRGRSVVNGTLTVNNDLRTVRHELSEKEKSSIESLILGFFSDVTLF
jgi:hypothetical protein